MATACQAPQPQGPLLESVLTSCLVALDPCKMPVSVSVFVFVFAFVFPGSLCSGPQSNSIKPIIVALLIYLVLGLISLFVFIIVFVFVFVIVQANGQ